MGLGWCWFLCLSSSVVTGLASWVLQCAVRLRERAEEVLLRTPTSSAGTASPTAAEYMAILSGGSEASPKLGSGRSTRTEGEEEAGQGSVQVPAVV